MPRTRIRALVIGCSAFALLLLALIQAYDRPAPGVAALPPDAANRLAFVHFWATWCGPCVEELPSVNRLAADYAGKPVIVLAYSLDTDSRQPALEKVTAFLSKQNLSHLTARIDADEALKRRFRVRSIPYTLLVAPDGTVVARFQEAMDWDSPQLRRLIDENLPAQ